MRDILDAELRKMLENHYSVLMREAVRIKALLDEDTKRRSAQGADSGHAGVSVLGFNDSQARLTSTIPV